MTAKVISLAIQPGIQRDGTQFDAPRYVDGIWTRFQRGRPRKMGGYNAMFLNSLEVSRGMIMQSQSGINYVYSGSQSYVSAWQTDDDDATGSGPTYVSLSNFTANANNLWQWDISYDSYGSGALTVIGHPGQNLDDIDSLVNTPVLIGNFPYGSMSQVGVFTAVGNLSSTTITIAATNYLIGVGQTVSGSGIPANTTVTGVTVVTSPSPQTTVTVSNSMTTSSGVTVTFNNNISVSGGCCMIYPYLFVYGNNGLIQNSSAGNFQNWVAADSNAANPTATKVVRGMPVRGGTTSPSGLFWSLDSLIRVSYAPQTVGTSTIYWRYDIISSQSSILSSQSVIEYDGIYYWAGVDRFLSYNGVVQEVPNQTNLNWFYDNLNYYERQKVWCTKIPRWGEIWWFYPRGNATECTDAIVYNVREQVWYDAGQALGARRSAGLFSEVFRYPIWAGWEPSTSGTYTLWQQEKGKDSVYLTSIDAVQSTIETNNLGWVAGGPGVRQISGDNKWIRLERVEPDFKQVGSMNLYVTGRGYADDTDVTTGPYEFSQDTLKIDMREQRREMRLRFESNTFNGDYEMGNILLSADIGDERGTGNP